MKHDAIVEQGIPILERVPIPDEMIPADSRVEIDAKIHGTNPSLPFPPRNSLSELSRELTYLTFVIAGYFTTGKTMTMEELQNVKGRGWDDVDH